MANDHGIPLDRHSCLLHRGVILPHYLCTHSASPSALQDAVAVFLRPAAFKKCSLPKRNPLGHGLFIPAYRYFLSDRDSVDRTVSVTRSSRLLERAFAARRINCDKAPRSL